MLIAKTNHGADFSDSILSLLLKRIFSSSPNMVTCMVAHVSPTIKSYHQTLQVLHLASQIQRSSAKRQTRVRTNFFWFYHFQY